MNRLIKIMLLLVLAAFCSMASAQEPDYADTGSWAYWRVGENKRRIYLLYARLLIWGQMGIQI